MKNSPLFQVENTLAYRFAARVESCGMVAVATFGLGFAALMFAALFCQLLQDSEGFSNLMGAALCVPLVGMFVGFAFHSFGGNRCEALRAPEVLENSRTFSRWLNARDEVSALGLDASELTKGMNTRDAANQLELFLSQGEAARSVRLAALQASSERLAAYVRACDEMAAQ